jgi:hypothetical protein
MEKGFHHPLRGYWQTTDEPSAAILATYPEGTVEIPVKPRADCEWDGSAWIDVQPPPPTSEQARAKRNGLLAQSDWSQLPDAPVDQAAWATYRQALRDITEQEGFPEIINWPTAPS